MNINLKPLSLLVGSVAGIIAILTIRHPIACLILAIIFTGFTEIILKISK